MVEVDKNSIKMDDLFKILVVAVPAVLCFILNAPVRMKPQEPSLNGLTMVDIIPELEGKENQRMTDVVCNMTKSDLQHLKYIQAVDKVEEEQDPYGWDDSLWDARRILRHRGENRTIKVL